MKAIVAALLVVVCCTDARADTTTEAKRLFAEGAASYDSGDFKPALDKFLLAVTLTPVPALNYNIARCLDKLERWSEAITYYERFLDARPDDRASTGIRERVRLLRARSDGEATARAGYDAAPRTREPRSGRLHAWVPSLAVGGLALGAAFIGTGLLARTRVEYDGCARPCTRAQIDHMSSLATGGYVMLGVAGAAAVVDLALIIAQARRAR